MLVWLSDLSGAMCRLAYGPADATATQYLLSCFSKIQIGFTFLVLLNGRVCVCVCMCIHVKLQIKQVTASI